MERFSVEQSARLVEGAEGVDVEAITEHSRKFDKHIAETAEYPPEAIREAWQVREWKIGEARILAIGVSHVPETFLEYRQELERAIRESDVVVNEFAPEALGMYDTETGKRLRSVRSRFNENYNLEQLRQAYLKYERSWNLGVFHHEVELLAAKYGKDMALADLTFSKDPEVLLQDDNLYAYGAEEVEEHKAALKKRGLYAGAAALGVIGLGSFLAELKKPMSRRKFLKLGLVAGAAAVAGATPKITETPPRTAVSRGAKGEGVNDQRQMTKMCDLKLAESLKRLTGSGYQKIVFIYGTRHINGVGEYLGDQQKMTGDLALLGDSMERSNPDAFRLYRLSPGENNSERFAASKSAAWKRIQPKE